MANNLNSAIDCIKAIIKQNVRFLFLQKGIVEQIQTERLVQHIYMEKVHVYREYLQIYNLKI